MNNLEQIRARNALRAALQGKDKFKGEQDGEVIKKIPPMILNHGLLASAAYGYEKDGWGNAFSALAEHLADPQIGLLPPECASHQGLVQFLTRKEASSHDLKLITAESLAWFNYARRFVNKGASHG